MNVEEEAAVFRRLRATGDAALRQQLITAHLWLVRLIAREYHARGWTQDDLEQQGILGLIMAIDDFDPDSSKHHSVRFHTLASWRIRDEIRSGIGPDISEQPTLPMQTIAPLQAPAWLLGSRETTQPLPILHELEQVAAPGPSVEEQVAARVDGALVSATLEAALALLSARQRFVIEHRYGLLSGGQVCTQGEIGRALGIHQSSVSRAERQALALLRAHLETRDDGAVILRALDEVGSKRRQRRSTKHANAA